MKKKINFYKIINMSTTKSHLLIVAALAFAACNETSSDNSIAASTGKDSITFDISSARSAVEASNTRFMESIRKGDSVGVAAAYTSDALIMPANSEAISGKDAAPFWGSFIRMGVKDAKLITEEVIGNAELLAETGKYEIYLADNKLADKGKYIVIWKQVDGSWKMYRDIFTTSLPAAPAKK
jgi:ketosteroid isomerase-like protein